MNSVKRSNQQNVDNLDVLTGRVVTFQPMYDPSESRLSIPNQKQVKSSGDEALWSVTAAESDCDNTTSARTAAFGALDPLVTRVINAVRISDVPEQTIQQVESIVRELRNVRASGSTPPVITTEGTENGASPRTNKKRSGSYNTRIENFRKLIILLTTIAAYKPKENDLTIESLNNMLAALIMVNGAWNMAEAKADAARQQRDIVLYTARTGLVAIAMDSKRYVKSAYGARSSQFKSISGITFTNKNKANS